MCADVCGAVSSSFGRWCIHRGGARAPRMAPETAAQLRRRFVDTRQTPECAQSDCAGTVIALVAVSVMRCSAMSCCFRAHGFAVVGAAFLIAGFCSRPAVAQGMNTSERSDQLFAEGVVLLEQRNFAEACPKFEES